MGVGTGVWKSHVNFTGLGTCDPSVLPGTCSCPEMPAPEDPTDGEGKEGKEGGAMMVGPGENSQSS